MRFGLPLLAAPAQAVTVQGGGATLPLTLYLDHAIADCRLNNVLLRVFSFSGEQKQAPSTHFK